MLTILNIYVLHKNLHISLSPIRLVMINISLLLSNTDILIVLVHTYMLYTPPLYRIKNIIVSFNFSHHQAININCIECIYVCVFVCVTAFYNHAFISGLSLILSIAIRNKFQSSSGYLQALIRFA